MGLSPRGWVLIAVAANALIWVAVQFSTSESTGGTAAIPSSISAGMDPDWYRTLPDPLVDRETAEERHRRNGTPLGRAVNRPGIPHTEINWELVRKHGFCIECMKEQPFLHNQLYLRDPPHEVRRVRDSIEKLDDALLEYRRRHPRAAAKQKKKPLLGYTGRGWGIVSGPISNKWRFYHRILLQYAEPLPGAKVLCEAGMLAGHSTQLFLSTVRNVSKMVVFDLKQPGTWYGNAAEEHFTKAYPGVFEVHWGYSEDTVPRYVKENPEHRCHFVSMDAEKSYPYFQKDLYWLRKMVLPETVLVFDDLTPSVVRTGVVNPEDYVGKPIPTDASKVLAWHLANKEMTLVECWDADREKWASYGVCAVRFNLSASFTVPEAVLTSYRGKTK